MWSMQSRGETQRGNKCPVVAPCAGAATAKCHGVGGLNGDLYLQPWEPPGRAVPRLLLSAFLGLEKYHPNLCLHFAMRSCLCVCVQMSLF